MAFGGLSQICNWCNTWMLLLQQQALVVACSVHLAHLRWFSECLFVAGIALLDDSGTCASLHTTYVGPAPGMFLFLPGARLHFLLLPAARLHFHLLCGRLRRGDPLHLQSDSRSNKKAQALAARSFFATQIVAEKREKNTLTAATGASEIAATT